MNRFAPRPSSFAFSLAIVLAICGGSRLAAQDTELANYKSGIDVTYSGVKGTDYMEEYFYHDKLITSAKVVYLRDTTKISMTHNARNVASTSGSGYNATIGVNGADGVANSGDEGKIRYRLDRDMQWGPRWGDYSTNNNPVYSGPISLDSLSYESGVPVVGTTGPKAGIAVSDYSKYYWRGHKDPYGDEWHVFQIADDDSGFALGDSEWRASDGKLLHVVVNPKTPALTVRATGNAQFYTTPPKAYFVPKVHGQTTYFTTGTGTVTFELKDIFGHNVFYRINGGAWVTGANPKLTDANFNPGTNTLEYYYEGNAAYTKKRVVVKNPGFPSAGESHGNLLWKDATGLALVKKRITYGDYLKSYNFMRTSNAWNAQTAHDSNFGKGLRRHCAMAEVNAFVALTKGWGAIPTGKTKSYARYAKESLLDSFRVIDPVGSEISHSNTLIPSRELYYRGYYDFDDAFEMAVAYDILIAGYRSDQQTGGITPIEDYFIRDLIARYSFDAMMQEGHWHMKEYPSPGMWGTARNIAGLISAMVIPSYSTPYFGTSGFDGNTTVYPWTPFPDKPLTWKKVFLDNNASISGYPNLAFRFGVEEYLITADGQWNDRVSYFDDSLMGHCFMILLNVTKMHHPSVSYPRLEAAFGRAAAGTLMGLKDGSGPSRMSAFRLYNPNFPTIAAASHKWMLSLDSTSLQSDTKQWIRSLVSGLAWYDSAYFGPVVTAPTKAQVTIGVSPP